MLVGGGSRISHHLRECNHRNQYSRDTQQALAAGLGFCSSRIVHFSSLVFKPGSTVVVRGSCYQRSTQPRIHSFSALRSKSPGEIPFVSDCFSEREDDCKNLSEGFSSVAGGIVALGKFEALHIGHRELAIQASKIGVPYLLSFVGMAEVLGWEPRAPIVAKCDRHRVLSSWAPYCGNVVPAEFQVEFSNVRHLTPRQFVEKLCKELEVTGVVAGENYRFGYKAAGDTRELTQLCKEFGIQACIINSVMDKHQDPSKLDLNDFKDKGQVSSTRVRHALAAGDMEYVTELVGRRHRLMLTLNGFARDSSRRKISAPRSSLLNLPPKDGFYENCSVFVGEVGTGCRVLIDSSGIHIEVEEDAVGFSSSDDSKHLGIEFGN
ncbi:FAD synthetase 2, chloroplastic [Linum perenne]